MHVLWLQINHIELGQATKINEIWKQLVSPLILYNNFFFYISMYKVKWDTKKQKKFLIQYTGMLKEKPIYTVFLDKLKKKIKQSH